MGKAHLVREHVGWAKSLYGDGAGKISESDFAHAAQSLADPFRLCRHVWANARTAERVSKWSRARLPTLPGAHALREAHEDGNGGRELRDRHALLGSMRHCNVAWPHDDA